MSQSQNTVPNGSFPEGSDVKNTYNVVKTHSNSHDNHSQPTYPQYQADGSVSPRPQLIRIDSRTGLQLRAGFSNPLHRPQQPTPPLPGGPPTPFIQRPQGLPRASLSGQPIYTQNQIRSNPPLNGAQISPPRHINPGPNPNVNVRPPTPFQRPPILRPQQGLFQPRINPGGPTRPSFNSYQPAKSLDSTESNLTFQTTNNVNDTSENKDNTDRPALTIMKTRSLSLSGNNIEARSSLDDDRRRSISSVDSIEEEKRIMNSSDVVNEKVQGDVYSRPETRTETYMKMIEEKEDDLIVPVKNPSCETTSPTIINSNESLNEKISSPPKELPSLPSSPSPQLIKRSYDVKTPEQTESKEEIIKTPGKKTQDIKSPRSVQLKLNKTEGDNDSGVDESTQGNDHLSNGNQNPPRKSTKISTPRSSTTPTKNRSFSRGSKSPNPKSPDTPTASTPGSTDKKKVPMNKIQVGSAPSPNLKVVKSKIGSLQNASYKPGGGHIKIESRKVDFSTASSRIAAKNDTYIPSGGDKKIQQQKLSWSAKSKIGSLENATHKPKGGDKKIESVKLDFKDKAKSKVGSKENMKHVPGGGDVKFEQEQEEIIPNIESKKLDIKVQSKIGSLDNIKHKPGGGDKKIFDDKDYLRQTSSHSDGSQKKKIPRPQSIELGNLVSPTQQKVKILEEVQVNKIPSPGSRPSYTLPRSASAKTRPSTPRPLWRY